MAELDVVRSAFGDKERDGHAKDYYSIVSRSRAFHFPALEWTPLSQFLWQSIA